jgi:hypothetical protein
MCYRYQRKIHRARGYVILKIDYQAARKLDDILTYLGREKVDCA